MRAYLVVVGLGLFVACERAEPKRASAVPAPTTGSNTPKVVENDSWAGPAPADPAKVRAEIGAAMDEFLAYSESVLQIMRDHGKDCDRAAKVLAARAPVFLELAPRVMRVKDQLASLPEAERKDIEARTDQQMEAFKTRNGDLDAITKTASACVKTSTAFAEIESKVMFTKKK